MKNENFIRVGRQDDRTQFLIESLPKGVWSGGPEIRISHELDGKRSQLGPSVTLDEIPNLIHALLTQYAKLVQQKD